MYQPTVTDYDGITNFAIGDNTSMCDVATENFCFSAWIRSDGFGTDHYFFKKEVDVTGYYYRLQWPAGFDEVLLADSSGEYSIIDGDRTGLQSDNWFFIAWVLDRSGISGCHHYVGNPALAEGSRFLEDTLSYSEYSEKNIEDVGTISNSDYPYIAGRGVGGGYKYDGKIFDIKLYVGGLWTEEEVYYQFRNPFDYCSRAGTITEYWRCDEASGLTLSGSDGNDFTLSSDIWTVDAGFILDTHLALIASQGHFESAIDRLGAIATQGHFDVELSEVALAEAIRIYINDLVDKYSVTSLKDKYLVSFLPDKYSVAKLDNE